MPNSAFRKNYDLIKIDDALGLVYGWGAIYTESGQEYFDTQGDSIDPEGMQAAALDFMENSRVAGDLHAKHAGTVPFMLPISSDVAKALDLSAERTGLAMAMRPNEEVLAKFKSGEYTGFSIGGTRLDEEVVEKFEKGQGENDGKFKQGKRRRMKKFKLNEISAVDRPAQVGAKALLLKREDGAGERDQDFDKRAMLTSSTDGHAHLVVLDNERGDGARSHGETNGGGVDFHSHPWIMKADGEIVFGAGHGHSHEPGEISTTREIAISRLMNKTEDQIMDQKEHDKLLAKVERLETIAAMPGEQKTYFDTLAGDAAAAFLAKNFDEKEKEMNGKKKKKNGDAVDKADVVYTSTDGTEFTKSDDPRFVTMAKERDADKAKITRLEVETTTADLQKRAETGLSHYPGEVSTHVELLRAVDTVSDEKVRGEIHKMIAAGDAAIKGAFEKLGGAFPTVDGDSAIGKMETIAKKIQADSTEGISYVDAYALAGKQNPELYKEAMTGAS